MGNKKKHIHCFGFVIFVLALSFLFSAYVFCLDIAALVYSGKLVPAYNEWYGLSNDTTGGHRNDTVSDLLEGLPITYLVMDLIIFLLFITFIFSDVCHHSLTLQWLLIIFPIMNLTGHADQIIIGFTHNIYHASAVSVLYGIALVIAVASLNIISNMFKDRKDKRKCECCICTSCFLFLLVIIFLIFGFFIGTFILLPINSALDEGPNNLVTVYQSIIIAFITYISYWFLIKEPTSPLDFLIKMKDYRLKDKEWNELNEGEKKWVKNTKEEKEQEFAEQLEKIMKKQVGGENELAYQSD